MTQPTFRLTPSAMVLLADLKAIAAARGVTLTQIRAAIHAEQMVEQAEVKDDDGVTTLAFSTLGEVQQEWQEDCHDLTWDLIAEAAEFTEEC